MSALATTVYELFADNLPARADKALIIDDGQPVTYAEISARVGRVAGLLAAHGIQPGDRVIVQLPKEADEVAGMLAVAKLGAVFVNINAQWTYEQFRYVVEDCAAGAALVRPAIASRLAEDQPLRSLKGVLTSYDWREASKGRTAAPVHRLDTELAAIIYTSGSTGAPKGVMLSHRNIVAGARSVARYLRLDASDRLLGVLPYSFDYGLNQLTTMLLVGGTVVHQRVLLPTEIVRTMVEQRVTGVAAVPPLWHQIARLLVARPAAFPALRRITNSGGKIPTNILQQLPGLFPGAEIYLMYGLTEAFRSTFLPPERFSAKPGSIGQAIPGAEIHVIKAGIGVAGPGEQGELVHRGPLVAQGYWGRPEATREKIRPCPELGALIGDEPVVHSGDLVRIDADGDLWFIGRNDAMIKTSGFRVSPDEVEDLVYRSGMIADAVAFGVDDDVLGQVVHVAITPLERHEADALMAHCRQVMPSYMVPRAFHLWPSPMPRTASGKLARPDVVRGCERILAERAASAAGAAPLPH